MVKAIAAAAFAALASTAAAARCQNLTIPISVSARNGQFDVKNPTDNIEATNFALRMARQGHNYTMESLIGYHTVSGDYNISATYCEPDAGPGQVLQILTHGIGFDRSYWDFSYNNYNYSYVREAVDQHGYSTFAWDRLGIGMSTRFQDPINEGQLWIETAAVQSLTESFRNQQISGVSAQFQNIVHVGHSFGSSITYALTAANPGVSDGIVLTGFSQNASFASQFILGSNFIIANTVSALSSYPTGYLAPNSPVGAHIDFFAPGDFDPDVLQVAYMNGQPVTPGEILTLVGASGAPNSYGGPVLIVTGEHDTPYCGGDCFATGDPQLASIPAASEMFFPNAQNFYAAIIPGAGHGLNLQYSHTMSYSTIFNYLSQNGLSS
ncbi:hypothetical protein LTR70_009224 [Exophiala xenobiotica]|uniref:AB hydrolase-1 domain-containing protein n=1 Tax=Lithohypha guttulata TaxID=1690604 RepID=A0ABR0KGR0_9EURO|nr:hypothetical protein LTR24_002723 [Lithohypha guttulata]KAK5310797.1 hypothetical protein LTR70_009224 [Exophiala xenobiotica]